MALFGTRVLRVKRARPDLDVASLRKFWTREASARRLSERSGRNYPELNRTLDCWAVDDDFWLRRSAMLALLRPLRRGGGDFARFGRYADRMLDEREFFIRKAIGWVLRETAKNRPDLVYDWLLPRMARASGITVREAVRWLPAGQRDELLAAYGSAKVSGARRATGRRASRRGRSLHRSHGRPEFETARV